LAEGKKREKIIGTGPKSVKEKKINQTQTKTKERGLSSDVKKKKKQREERENRDWGGGEPQD